MSPRGKSGKKAGALAGLLLFPALLAGCASREKRGGLPAVAVLPLANESVHLEAADKVRGFLAEELAERGYPVLGLEEVDAALRELGFTDGGQLGALDLSALRGRVPAGLYAFGTVEEWSFKTAVALSQREVAVRLRVVDGDGRVLLDRSEKGITTRAGADAAGDLVLNLGGRVFKAVKDGAKKVVPDKLGGAELKDAADLTDEVADVDMKQETRQALRKLLAALEKALP